jgi:hypothetical protein
LFCYGNNKKAPPELRIFGVVDAALLAFFADLDVDAG